MAEHGDGGHAVPLSALEPEEKARRAGSFGEVADHYERFRPGPPPAAVDWLVPEQAGRVVDLGAGTGAMTRLLVDRAAEVVAVEPDSRMRDVLERQVPLARTVEGRGEAIPLPDASADAVVACTSWHWMEPAAALAEVHRVLVPAGCLGVLWTGPDPNGAFLLEARNLLGRSVGDRSGLADFLLGDAQRPSPRLEIPTGSGFSVPERRQFVWEVALDADELLGLLGTFSWVINLDEGTRARLFGEARRLLTDVLGLEPPATVDVTFAAGVWRTERLG